MWKKIDMNALEPDGGNIYMPHLFMVNSGQFWRCKHGITGFASGMKWEGCFECAKDNPDAFAEWSDKVGFMTSAKSTTTGPE